MIADPVMRAAPHYRAKGDNQFVHRRRVGD